MLAEGESPSGFGTEVAPRIIAQHHAHTFSLRLCFFFIFDLVQLTHMIAYVVLLFLCQIGIDPMIDGIKVDFNITFEPMHEKQDADFNIFFVGSIISQNSVVTTDIVALPNPTGSLENYLGNGFKVRSRA